MAGILYADTIYRARVHKHVEKPHPVSYAQHTDFTR